MRICIIGDELITPMGDPRGLGWVGRVLARSEFPSPPTVMTLAVPGETTSQLAAHWEDEVVYRFAPDEPCALIIAVGCSDIPPEFQLHDRDSIWRILLTEHQLWGSLRWSLARLRLPVCNPLQ